MCVQVAIEAMQRKTSDLVAQVQRSPPDLKRLQLLLQGCVSTQVCTYYYYDNLLAELLVGKISLYLVISFNCAISVCICIRH